MKFVSTVLGFKKAYYRIFQFCMGLGMKIIPWFEPEVIEGPGSIEKLPAVIREKGVGRVLEVTDAVLMGLNMLDSLFGALKAAGIQYYLYDQVQPNPTIDNIEAALKVYKDNDCQAIIAFGGGSPMDCAKATGARVQLSHLKASGRNNWGRGEAIVDRLRKARAAGAKVTGDQYAYDASSTSIDVLFPGTESYDLGRNIKAVGIERIHDHIIPLP